MNPNTLAFRNIIVGAGMTGLTLARAFESEPTVVLEKSRGVGGRMATRRNGDYTYDHGAQFYVRHAPSDPDNFWTDNGLAQEWFEKEGAKYKAARGGITSLTKALFPRERIELDQHVERVAPIEQGWQVFLQNGVVYSGARVLLTCPLPQTLEILRRSRIAYESELDQIHYKKALVGLFAIEDKNQSLANVRYIENVSTEIFSIANQKSKAVSGKLAFTVVMQPDWSDRHFASTDESGVLNLIWSAFERFLKSTSPGGYAPFDSTLKKWRFAQPANTYRELFLEPQPGLYVAGDAFGGASVMGAYRSAEALARKCLANACITSE